jgi:hypothetical protein
VSNSGSKCGAFDLHIYHKMLQNLIEYLQGLERNIRRFYYNMYVILSINLAEFILAGTWYKI